MTTQNSDLVVQNLTRSFQTAAGTLSILNGVNLTLSRGEALAITGPSGSGKSTLLYIIGTLDKPTSGTVQLSGKDPFQMSTTELASWRNQHIGFIFQDHHLLPQCTVLENVLIPTLAGKGANSPERDRAMDLLTRVGLADRIHHKPSEISGGERQRVAVCRALINRPLLLLADEPTGNLDQVTAESVGSLLLDLGREENTILICVTHSVELANRFPKLSELRQGVLKSVRSKAHSVVPSETTNEEISKPR